MSADNWAICPKCLELEEDKQEALEEKISKSYGVVSPEEYMRLVEKSRNRPSLELTLREDYEIGILNTAEFYVRYKGQCPKCGFTYTYKSDQPIDL